MGQFNFVSLLLQINKTAVQNSCLLPEEIGIPQILELRQQDLEVA